MLSAERGVTLIELAIALVLLGLVLALAAPAYVTWAQNTQARTAAEAVKNGLQLARTEALRRNKTVRFQLVDKLDASCKLSASGPHWVVSLEPAAGKCDVAPSEDIAPRIVQKRPSTEGSAMATLEATDAAGVDAASVAFDGLGRVRNADAARRFDVAAAKGNRPLRVLVGPGGEIRLCDPAFPAGDPNGCQ